MRALLATAIAFILGCRAVSAALIVWGKATTITGDNDVRILGTLDRAYALPVMQPSADPRKPYTSICLDADTRALITRVMRRQLALQVLAVVCASALARADVAFSDLAATSPYYSTSSAYQVWGFGTHPSYASSFVSLTTGNISTVSVGISRVFSSYDGPLNLSLSVVAPDSTGFTSILLGTVSANSTLQDGSQLGILSLSTLTSPLLSQGQTYYLIVSAASTNTWDYWWSNSDPNNPNYQSNIYSSQDGAPFTLIGPGPAPAFEVNTVAAVPEPTTWMLSCLGVGAILWCRRRTRKCVVG